MVLQARALGKIPADTAELGWKLAMENAPYHAIGDRLGEIVRDEDFAAMCAETGRDVVWSSSLALVTLFQSLEGIPDRETAEMVAKRLDWKYVPHLPLEYGGFHFPDPHNFRQRLLENRPEALAYAVWCLKFQ